MALDSHVSVVAVPAFMNVDMFVRVFMHVNMFMRVLMMVVIGMNTDAARTDIDMLGESVTGGQRKRRSGSQDRKSNSHGMAPAYWN